MAAATSPNALNQIGKVPSFSDQVGGFEEWSFRARSVLAALHEDADDDLGSAEQLVAPFPQSALTVARAVSQAVFHSLSSALSGRASVVARLAERGNGLDLWRRLHSCYLPTASGVATALLVRLLILAWSATAASQGLSFSDVLGLWDLERDRHEARSSDKISAGTRIAVAVRHGSPEMAVERIRLRLLGALRLYVAAPAAYSGHGFLGRGPGLPGTAVG